LKVGHEVAQLPESWNRKVEVMSPMGPRTKNDCVREVSSNFSNWTTKGGLWLVHRTAGIYSWLENWTVDLVNYADINTENDIVLQVCVLHDTRKNVVPNLPHAFECCWQTCKQTFTNPQAYFNHVETHVYCNPRGRIVKGGIPCHWRGEF
jgi:hypothetical protein